MATSDYTDRQTNERATPSTPPTSFSKIYPKPDGFWYILDSTGAERRLLFSSISQQVDQSGGTGDTFGVLAGLVNGSNTTFTVSLGKYVSGKLEVYRNGNKQIQGTSEDWVEISPGGGTFGFNTAPLSGDHITAVYYTDFNVPLFNADLLDGLEGSAFQRVRTLTNQSTTYTITNTVVGEIVHADATGGAFTVTLPDATQVGLNEYRVKRINSGSNNVTVAAAGSQLIEGVASVAITVQYGVLNLYSNGSNWFNA